MKKKMKDIFSLKDKIVVITGGSGFLGSEFALTLSNIGAMPIVLDKNKNSLQLLEKKFKKKKLRGLFFLVDLNNENKVNVAIDLIIKKYKKIDCLINAAGFTGQEMLETNVNFFEKFEKYNFQLWQRSLNENLSSTFLVTKSVAKYMMKRKKGSIVNIASDVGIISPDHRIYEPNKRFNYKGVSFNTPLSYSVAKSGIISMTRYLATYWAKKGIRVNCVSPAGVYKKHNKKFVEQLSQRIPLGRMAKSDELNGAIIYLCSNASSYVTGHNLVVDGGRTIW
jgi:NAD(P)-dependent dehydrogenase (short-subunit alcohol dehydrogenase family)|tara:strand:+ start:780 stop:1619 length:840 start_codon:yes stop_codon:yes gene_type:complete